MIVLFLATKCIIKICVGCLILSLTNDRCGIDKKSAETKLDMIHFYNQ